jgi:hypothetical protein
MNPEETIRIIESEMGLKLAAIAGTYDTRLSKNHPGLRLRCMTAFVLDQEGYGKAFIGRKLGVSANRVYGLIFQADSMLSARPQMKGYDKHFKKTYLSIMGRITELEDAA